MKKLLSGLLLAPLAVTACGSTDAAGNAEKTVTAYSYKTGDMKTSNQRVKASLTLKDNIIEKVAFAFEKTATDGEWDGTITRRDDQSITATRNSNTFAGLKIDDINTSDSVDDIKAGVTDVTTDTSMFDIEATDMMSTYAVVKNGNKVDVAIMGANSRIMYEASVDVSTDGTKMLNAIEWRINNSHYGSHKAVDGDMSTTPFNYGSWEKVAVANGIFKGLSASPVSTSSFNDLVAKFGTLEDGKVKAGFHSMGGWFGNYRAIENTLKGKDASKFNYLWKAGLTDTDPVLGSKPDSTTGNITGSTNIQDSTNTIAGATVRTSRENHAYQLALVEAGIMKAEDVFKVKW